MSDTPISDSTPHNVADLGMLCRRLERELNAANQIIRQQQLLDEENLRLQHRIKQLEDRIHRAAMAFFEDVPHCQVASGMLSILEEERRKQ